MSLVTRRLGVVIETGIKRGRKINDLTREDDLSFMKKVCSSSAVGVSMEQLHHSQHSPTKTFPGRVLM